MFRGNQDLQGSNVIVEGLGNRNFCVSRPRLKDTRIFFVNNKSADAYRFGESNIQHFRLRSSLLRPTIENHDILSGLNKYTRNIGKHKHSHNHLFIKEKLFNKKNQRS